MQNAEGDISLTFKNVPELETAMLESKAAFKRSFDAEEHTCEICTRSLLGDKFTFLSSCEHFFCTECLSAMIILKIDLG